MSRALRQRITGGARLAAGAPWRLAGRVLALLALLALALPVLDGHAHAASGSGQVAQASFVQALSVEAPSACGAPHAVERSGAGADHAAGSHHCAQCGCHQAAAAPEMLGLPRRTKAAPVHARLPGVRPIRALAPPVEPPRA